jgi:hypothetical protein
MSLGHVERLLRRILMGCLRLSARHGPHMFVIANTCTDFCFVTLLTLHVQVKGRVDY